MRAGIQMIQFFKDTLCKLSCEVALSKLAFHRIFVAAQRICCPLPVSPPVKPLYTQHSFFSIERETIKLVRWLNYTELYHSSRFM